MRGVPARSRRQRSCGAAAAPHYTPSDLAAAPPADYRLTDLYNEMVAPDGRPRPE